MSGVRYTGAKDSNHIAILAGDILESFVHPEIPLRHKVVWSTKYHGWFAKNINNPDGVETHGDLQLWVLLNNNKCVIVGI